MRQRQAAYTLSTARTSSVVRNRGSRLPLPALPADKEFSMPIHLCSTCGTSYPDAPGPPSRCAICDDERQFVPSGGQRWTTPEQLGSGHVNAWRQLEKGLFEIHTQPQFGIGQRALLVQTADGNVLWDCIALLDDATAALIRALGGLRAM